MRGEHQLPCHLLASMGEGELERLGTTPPLVVGALTSSPRPDLAPLSGQDSEVLSELDNLLRAY